MIYDHVPGFEPDDHAALISAILNLVPNASFSLVGDDLADIDWQDDRDMPSEADILAEVERCWQNWHDTEYQRQRAVEYPPVEDYLDGVVKGDQAQIDAYIAACLAVKNQYPKPV